MQAKYEMQVVVHQEMHQETGNLDVPATYRKVVSGSYQRDVLARTD